MEIYSWRVKALPAFILILLTAGCDTLSKNELPFVGDESDIMLADVDYKNLTFQEDDCDGQNCTTVEINYPQTSNDQFSRLFSQMITDELSNYLRITSGLSGVEEYSQAFIEEFYSFKEEFPETISKWEIEIDLDLTYQSQNLVCVKKTTESYTGGAHPNHYTNFSLYNENAKPVKISSIIKDREGLRKLVESEFRTENGIPEDISWEETGYLFENGNFTLPENIGLTKKGMVFYYNNYETASYAEGTTKIEIPFEKVRKYVSIEM